MSLLSSSMAISASGLHAERFRMDVIAHNLANSNTTRTEDGLPFKRRIVRFAEVMDETLRGVQVDSVEEDPSEGPKVFDPGAPGADAEGMVEGANVNPVLEMVDLLSATRAYEANITAFNAAKGMMLNALTIGAT
ncbi:MAG: hypothetical protein AMXMBFR61_05280 [Fimbriimonadales bacterium]